MKSKWDMNKIVKMPVQKMEAARRQLGEAILLYFDRGDPISIHTLVAAAHQILFDLCKHRGIIGASQIKDHPRVRPEKKREWLKIVKESENFFKHADNDPDATIDFVPELTAPLIVDAIEMYRMMGGKSFLEEAVFMIYFLQRHPEIIVTPELKQFISAVQSKQIRGFDSRDFEKYAGAIRFARTNADPNDWTKLIDRADD